MPEVRLRAKRGENIAKISDGQQYGTRIVLRELPRYNTKHGGYRLWECRCTLCGRIQKLQAHEILNPQGKWCPRCRNRSRRREDAPFKRVVASYKRNARKRGLAWVLSDVEIKQLFSAPCHYCGSEPANFGRPSTTAASDPQPNRGLVYSGIDRIDSTRGYETLNVVPCCRVCNWAKNKRTYAEFQEWLDRLVVFRLEFSAPSV